LLVLTPKSVSDTAESSFSLYRPTVHASPGSDGNFSDVSDMRVWQHGICRRFYSDVRCWNITI